MKSVFSWAARCVMLLCLPTIALAQGLSQSVPAAVAAAAREPAASPGQAGDATPADQAQPQTSDPWFHPFLIAVINANYNSSTQLPGSWTGFAAPAGPRNRSQLNISPANTVVGADFKLPNVKDTELAAKIDFNFRGAMELDDPNKLAPLFGDIYLEMKFDPLRFVFGQTTDIIAPLVPTTLNMYPWSYAPGNLGFFRPQIRVETSMPVGAEADMRLQGGIAQATQTYESLSQAVTRQSGWPDVQARGVFAYGQKDTAGARPFEIGFWGHFGERNFTMRTGEDIFNNTFSFGLDARLVLPTKTKVQGEYYTGQLVGEYRGGIFQTFDPQTAEPVAAQGFWLEAEQRVRPPLVVHAGYGIDNVEDADLGAAVSRKLNQVIYGNAFYEFSPELSVAGEVAWWRTEYRLEPAQDASPFRLEFAIIYKWFSR